MNESEKEYDPIAFWHTLHKYEISEDAQDQDEPLNVRKFRDTVKQMTEIYIRKNNDYGDSYSKSVEALGIIGGVAPIFNKCNRLISLATGNRQLVKGEAIEDTLLDMANYCIMLKIALESQNKPS